MLAAELVGKTKQEIKDLILFNTKEYDFQDDVIAASLEAIYLMFAETESVLLEKQALWQMILEGLFGFEGDITTALVNELGSFEFITFCEQTLGTKPEILLFKEMYHTHFTKRESMTALVSGVLSAFVEDLSDIKPEEINKIIEELNINLDQLPDFIKNAVK